MSSGPQQMHRSTWASAGFAALALALLEPISARCNTLQGPSQPTPLPVQPAAATAQPAPPARVRTGLVTIESDLQRADQSTGVITASGNVRIVYPDQRVVATARQAQYFSREGRVVLSGDVDIVQEGGNLLRAERVIYLVERDRLVAIPPTGQQVYSRVSLPARQRPAKP
ncbi:MAG: LptA/OstA family protein [Vulcanococcus sp.]